MTIPLRSKQSHDYLHLDCIFVLLSLLNLNSTELSLTWIFMFMIGFSFDFLDRAKGTRKCCIFLISRLSPSPSLVFPEHDVFLLCVATLRIFLISLTRWANKSDPNEAGFLIAKETPVGIAV